MCGRPPLGLSAPREGNWPASRRPPRLGDTGTGAWFPPVHEPAQSLESFRHSSGRRPASPGRSGPLGLPALARPPLPSACPFLRSCPRSARAGHKPIGPRSSPPSTTVSWVLSSFFQGCLSLCARRSKICLFF